MTREEQLKFCATCTKRSFNPKLGVTCSLTAAIATFENSCPDYAEDAKELKMAALNNEQVKTENKRVVSYARLTLFIIGLFYVGIGYFEGYVIQGADPLYAYIDWTVAGIFAGLGFWSYKNPFWALISGLIVYGLIVVLMALVDPTTLIRGILWKVLITASLVGGIRTARNEYLKKKIAREDLIDEF